jgi:hypothetical protein
MYGHGHHIVLHQPLAICVPYHYVYGPAHHIIVLHQIFRCLIIIFAICVPYYFWTSCKYFGMFSIDSFDIYFSKSRTTLKNVSHDYYEIYEPY